MDSPGTPPPPYDARNPEDEVRWGAVAIGVVVDFVATMLAGFVVSTVALAIAASRGADEDGALEYLQSLQAAPDFVLAFTLLGLLCVSLGGFVAARRAGHGGVRHGALVGVGSVVVTLLLDSLWPSEPDPDVWNPVWLEFVGYLLVIPFGMLGGAFADRIREEDAPRRTSSN